MTSRRVVALVAAAATAAWASAIGTYRSVQKRSSTSSKIFVPIEPSGRCSKTTYTYTVQGRKGAGAQGYRGAGVPGCGGCRGAGVPGCRGAGAHAKVPAAAVNEKRFNAALQQQQAVQLIVGSVDRWRYRTVGGSLGQPGQRAIVCQLRACRLDCRDALRHKGPLQGRPSVSQRYLVSEQRQSGDPGRAGEALRRTGRNGWNVERHHGSFPNVYVSTSACR